MQKDLTTLLIPFVYFIAGAVGLASVAATFLYKEELGFTLQQVQFLGSLSVIPWSIKPLYGLVSDRLPVFGLRRKPYLVVAGLLGSIGYLSMGLFAESFWGVAAAMVTAYLGFAIADVIVDGIVAERSRSQKEAGKLQSICRGAIMLGALLSGFLSGHLVALVGPRQVYLITSALPLLTLLFAFCMYEEKSSRMGFALRETWRKIRTGLTPPVLWTALFLFVWRSTPNSGGSLTYYMIDELQFNPEFFGTLNLVGHAMGIAGVVVFRKFLISIPMKKLLFWIIVASVVLSLPSLGLVYGWYEALGMSPKMFALADTFLTGPLTEIGFLPLLVLTARVCPKGVEATMFALLASIMNIGLAISDLGGAALVTLFDVRQATESLPANYASIDKVLWIAIFSSFLPMPFIRFLPDIRGSDDLSASLPSQSGEADGIPGSQRDRREIA